VNTQVAATLTVVRGLVPFTVCRITAFAFELGLGFLNQAAILALQALRLWVWIYTAALTGPTGFSLDQILVHANASPI